MNKICWIAKDKGSVNIIKKIDLLIKNKLKQKTIEKKSNDSILLSP